MADSVPPDAAASEPLAPHLREDLGRYRWVAMGVVLIGTFMVILDTSIVNVALPQIGEDFHSVTKVEWVVTVYLLALGLAQPPTGWLTDRFGKRNVFCMCLLLFSAGSLACVLAPNLGFLVGFRVLQGLGGGGMAPVGLAIVYELFPPDRRGTALGIWGIAVMAAPAIGPVLGGWLVTTASWRLLFFINVPIGVVGLVLARRLLHDVVPRTYRPLDWQALVMAAIGLGALLLGLSQAPSWGWGTPGTLACLLVGGTVVVAWIVRCLRARHPLVQMRMFASPTFSLCIIVLLLLTMAQYGRLVFIPLELENLRGFSALHVGVMLVPTAACAAAMMVIGGRLADRIGPRVPTTLGVALIGLSTWGISTLDLHTSDVLITGYLALGGLGMGLSMMPTTVAALLSLPNRMAAEASSLRTLSRQVSGALGIAVLSTVIAVRLSGVPRPPISPPDLETAQSAYNLVFTIAALACVPSFLVALLLPGRRKTRELQQIRATEPGDVELAFAE